MKKWIKIFTFAMVTWSGPRRELTPNDQPDRKISIFLQLPLSSWANNYKEVNRRGEGRYG